MNRILQKALSARWLIAIILTIVFAVLAITSKLSTEFLSVYTLVIAFYYNKDRSATDKVDENKAE